MIEQRLHTGIKKKHVTINSVSTAAADLKHIVLLFIIKMEIFNADVLPVLIEHLRLSNKWPIKNDGIVPFEL